MARHSLNIEFANAIRRRQLAEQECAHWDFEDGVCDPLTGEQYGDRMHDCCIELGDAEREVKTIKRKRKNN